MRNLGSWDIALLVIAAYVAITALVRLMLKRRDELVESFRAQMRSEQKRKEAELRKQKEEEQLKQWRDAA